jgi:parallel beta-helix repeat protein
MQKGTAALLCVLLFLSVLGTVFVAHSYLGNNPNSPPIFTPKPNPTTASNSDFNLTFYQLKFRPVYIRPDGSIDPPEIAIKKVADNYYKLTNNISNPVIIQKSGLVLEGAGYALDRAGCGMHGGETAVSFLGVNNVKIKNIVITYYNIGINLTCTSGNIIANVNFVQIENGNSIIGFNCTETVISENTFAGVYGGIRLSYGGHNTVSKNNLSGGSEYCGGISFEAETFDVINWNTIIHAYEGIMVYESSYIEISNNTATQNYRGYSISALQGGTISFNIASNNEVGCYIGATNSAFISNAITDNVEGLGIGGNCVFRNNRIDRNTYSIFGGGNGDIDTSNTVNNKPIYYWVNQQDRTVPTDAGYVALVNCKNITVQDLNILDNGEAIRLESTSNSIIIHNTLTNINAEESNYNIISNNRINSGFIHCIRSNSNQIIQNNLVNSSVIISNGKNNNISSNTIVDGITKPAIAFESSEQNVVYANQIENNQCGLSLANSDDNEFSYNNIYNNYRGIYIGQSNNNKIFQNNIYSNLNQTYVDPKNGTSNYWDNGLPLGGNYWSNYLGKDVNSDGFGDTPHKLDDVNFDYYPLTKPIKIPDHFMQ